MLNLPDAGSLNEVDPINGDRGMGMGIDDGIDDSIGGPVGNIGGVVGVVGVVDARPSKRMKCLHRAETKPMHPMKPSASVVSLSTSSSSESSSSAAIIVESCKIEMSSDALSCLALLFAPLPKSLIPSKSNSPPIQSLQSIQSDDDPDDGDDSLSSFRELWKRHGFRTTTVTCPRTALSIYLDSCRGSRDIDGFDNSCDAPGLESSERSASASIVEGRKYLQHALSLHPDQKVWELEYANGIRDIYCFTLFCDKLNSLRRDTMNKQEVRHVLYGWENQWKECLKHVHELTKQMKHPVKVNQVDPVDPSIPISSKLSKTSKLANTTKTILSQLISSLTTIDHSLRKEQLLHEYNRIAYENCTLGNACWNRWLGVSKWEIRRVFFQGSPLFRYLPKYERITIRLRDSTCKEEEGKAANSTKFLFLPSLIKLLNSGERSAQRPQLTKQKDRSSSGSTMVVPTGIRVIVDDMLQTTWDELLRNGYFVDDARKEQLGPELRKFYESGLLAGRDGSMPILLNAHFQPTYPLSLYLQGRAGSGKSSLLRTLLPALQSTISQHCDPELMVRYVKQNLNKPYKTLELELELRPNNNDYSVMSIIQGRRMTLSQSKPGLVLVGLEEMPPEPRGVDADGEECDPRQGEVGKLLSMRFGGRKGDFKQEVRAPRNSEKKGISGDATIITIFTSNYDLDPSCKQALQRLEMFRNLTVVKVHPIAGEDRKAFALSYLTQRVEESLGRKGRVSIELKVPCGEGDTRPLVRYLRMLAFYIHALVLKSGGGTDVNVITATTPAAPIAGSSSATADVNVSVAFDSTDNITTVTTANGKVMQLKQGSFHNLYAITPPILDTRASHAVEELRRLHPSLENSMELAQILDFYFAKTLAPAVILSRDMGLIHDLIAILSKSSWDGNDDVGHERQGGQTAGQLVHGILNIDPTEYKMMRSLYDPIDTPNLRDDILQILRDGGSASPSSPTAGNSTLVAIELRCPTLDAQLNIREIIEDTPSMTAFSTERSALYKEGLLFGVFVKGEITPEIESRASLII